MLLSRDSVTVRNLELCLGRLALLDRLHLGWEVYGDDFGKSLAAWLNFTLDIPKMKNLSDMFKNRFVLTYLCNRPGTVKFTIAAHIMHL